MVMMYGIGGIGMTTMVPNALLMKAIMGERKALSLGFISNTEWLNRLQTSRFSKILHWDHRNPFDRNYAQYVDNVRQPQVFAKYLRPKWYFRPAQKFLRFTHPFDILGKLSFFAKMMPR